jgi:hypothetical protein
MALYLRAVLASGAKRHFHMHDLGTADVYDRFASNQTPFGGTWMESVEGTLVSRAQIVEVHPVELQHGPDMQAVDAA